MQISGELKRVQLELLGVDPSGAANLVNARIWYNTAESAAKMSDGANSKTLLTNDNVKVGTSTTASENIKLHRAAANLLQILAANDGTAEGVSGTNLSNLSFSFEAYTTASRPANGNTGRVIFDTDLGVLLVDDGTNYKSLASNSEIVDAYINLGTASDIVKVKLSSDTRANLELLTREAGSIYYATDEEKFLGDDGTQLKELGGGSGQGGINHLGDNGDPDNVAGVGDWNDNPLVPSTFVVSSTDPLRGEKSFVVTDNTSGTAGDFRVLASCIFNIDEADKNKLLYIAFDFAKVFDTFSDNELVVVIRQNGNSQRLTVQNDVIEGVDTNYLMRFQATDVTEYRIELVRSVKNTTGTAFSFKIDNMSIGPREVVRTTGKTDFTYVVDGALSVVLNEGTVGISVTNTGTGKYKVYYDKSRFPSGALTSVEIRDYDVNAPSIGLVTADSSDGGGDFIEITTLSLSATQNMSATDEMYITFKQKEQDITTYATSTDLVNRNIVAEGRNNNGGAINGSTDINWTETKDTVNAFDGTTFIAPVSDEYHIEGAVAILGTNASLTYAYIDGVQDKVAAPSISGKEKPLSWKGFLEAGQALTFRFVGGETLDPNGNKHWISINKIGNDQTLLAEPREVTILKRIVTANEATATGLNIRTLTDIEGSNAVIDGNGFIPRKGKYRATITQSMFRTNHFKVYLYNETTSTYVSLDTPQQYAITSQGSVVHASTVDFTFEANGTDKYQVIVWCETGNATGFTGTVIARGVDPAGSRSMPTSIVLDKIY